MIEAVRKFGPRTAAGILSGLALALDAPDPERHYLPPLGTIEQQVLTELRETLRIAPDDHSANAIEQLADALDEEAARVAGIQPDASTTEQLNRAGLLPSDLVEIEFSPGLFEAWSVQNYGSYWETEKWLAETTVRHPHREQTFGPSAVPGLVSLFARFFVHRYPARSFWMIVTGARIGSVYSLRQMFRVYPQDVDLSGCESLLDVLEAFVNKFGADIEIEGKTGRFFYSLRERDQEQVGTFSGMVRKGESLAISFLGQPTPENAFLRLVFVVNLSVYLRAVESRHGFDHDIGVQIH
jgi:hypothetical protein